MKLAIRVDVEFFDHPKTANVGMEAAWLFLRMVAYSKKRGLHGLVPKAADLGKTATTRNVGRLLGAPFLHDHDEQHWRIHDWSVWQTAVEVSAKRSAAGSKGAAARWSGNGKSDGNCHSKPMAT